MIVQFNREISPFLPSFGEPKFVPGDNPHAGPGRDQFGAARKIKILVVDDEALIADTVVEILKHEGFEALALSDGSKAVEAARDYQPDIVLSDVIMPGVNGIEAGLRIRDMIPECRIILFSGQAATVDLLDRARAQGHNFDVLAKPIRPERLIQLIRSAAPRPS